MLERFRRLIRDYFGFSQKETNGTIVLSFLLFVLIFAPFLQSFFYKEITANVSDARLQDSLVSLLSRVSAEAEPPPPELDLSPFDPNKISTEKWLQFGLSKKVAQRIERYLAKGGKFRKKEDLLRVYDFPQDLYEVLEPYIQIESQQYARKEKKPYKQPKKYENKENLDTSRKFAQKEKKQFKKFDLNTADTAQLKTLRGIGEKRALNIIKYREKLGGFAQISQIEEVWGLDSIAIESVKKFTYITPNSWKKIAINQAGEEELKKHLYIGYKLAKVLVNYRLQHGKFTSEADLRKVKALDENTLQKLLPYVSFE